MLRILAEPSCSFSVKYALPSTGRYFSSSVRRLAKQSTESAKADRRARDIIKGGAPEALTIADASAVLRAVEIATPWSTCELHVMTHFVKGSAPPRGRISLPRDPRASQEQMLVFAEGKKVLQAKKLGAAYAGGAELIDDVLSGKISPTKVLCTPALLPVITPKLARFLGPKGLMPAHRRGTVTDDIAAAVKQAKGTLDWKGDKQGMIRVPIGRVNYSVADLEKNVRTFLKGVQDATVDKENLFARKKSSIPSILQVHLTSRQGPGIILSDV